MSFGWSLLIYWKVKQYFYKRKAYQTVLISDQNEYKKHFYNKGGNISHGVFTSYKVPLELNKNKAERDLLLFTQDVCILSWPAAAIRLDTMQISHLHWMLSIHGTDE